MSISYAKPALNLEQQADLLLNRGLKDISKEALITKLSSVNYYRLRGYTYAYQDNTVVKYSVLAEAKQIFASKYELALPKPEELEHQIKMNRLLIEEQMKNRLGTEEFLSWQRRNESN